MKNYDAFGKILEDLSNLYQIPGNRLQTIFTWKTLNPWCSFGVLTRTVMHLLSSPAKWKLRVTLHCSPLKKIFIQCLFYTGNLKTTLSFLSLYFYLRPCVSLKNKAIDNIDRMWKSFPPSFLFSFLLLRSWLTDGCEQMSLDLLVTQQWFFHSYQKSRVEGNASWCYILVNFSVNITSVK